MRKILIPTLIGVGIVGFVFLSATHGGKCKHHKQHKAKCCEWMKEAKIEVSNIENGVTIKITSDKSEIVKKIQECVQKWEKCWKAGKCIHEKAMGKENQGKLEFHTIRFCKSTGLRFLYYDMVIHHTGTITVKVEDRLDVKGHVKRDTIISTQINDKEIENLKIMVREAEFFSLKDHYSPKRAPTDLGGHTITITYEGGKKSVSVYDYECIDDLSLSGLKALIKRLDNILGAVLEGKI